MKWDRYFELLALVVRPFVGLSVGRYVRRRRPRGNDKNGGVVRCFALVLGLDGTAVF